MSNSSITENDSKVRAGTGESVGNPVSSSVSVNVGCGQTPTAGFVNLDNSLSVKLASHRILAGVLGALGLVGKQQRIFIARAKALGVRWARAERLPFEDGSVALLYTSHMLEHLSRPEASRFLKEAFRVLVPGGWVRIVVPDIRKKAQAYIQGSVGADAFVESTLMAFDPPQGFLAKIMNVIVGPRHHLWMYDGESLCGLLGRHGFANAVDLPPGKSRIPESGALDLAERASESVYVEAQKPLPAMPDLPETARK